MSTPTAADRVQLIRKQLHLLEGQLGLLRRVSKEGELSIIADRSVVVDLAIGVLEDMSTELDWLEDAEGALTVIPAPDSDEREELEKARLRAVGD